jgi:mono/diheme cytochrome c family protein
MHLRIISLFLVLLAACSSPSDEPDNMAQADAESADAAPVDAEPGPMDATIEVDSGLPHWQSPVGPVEPSAQRPGDPEAGYDALVNNPYVTCGIPARIFNQFFGPAEPGTTIPGRTGLNENRRFYETAFVNDDGIELVTTNCLSCHMGVINGRMMLGLGNEYQDFTMDVGAYAGVVGNLAQGEAEQRAMDHWSSRMIAVAPFITMDTVGVNPAENLAAALVAHRDRHTLEWSDEPLIDISDVGHAPLSVPPWWNVKKKNALYYTTIGRQDHARFIMTASTLCTDSVEEAREIDSYFPDILAFIRTIEAPLWPGEINEELAAAGKTVFEATCTECHGTYGEEETYPNMVVSVDVVGTDPALARGSLSGGVELIEWYNESFYGELALAAPADGYIAPPLDGIWATAPYLHNGSVPTLGVLLNSGERPRFWQRSFERQEYDEENIGWIYEELDHGKDGERSFEKKKFIYDTSLPGYSNSGHTFGDHLSDADRSAVLEYLKTL